MKVVHLRQENKDDTDQVRVEIKELELLIRHYPRNERAYNRLMILYRKTGDYQQELKIINRAIKTFEELSKHVGLNTARVSKH